MHILFFNPQGNFDQHDSHMTEHPDFGGQLIYVKEVAMAMSAAGHRADIITRRIRDPEWPEFGDSIDYYSGYENKLRIIRIPCGGDRFLNKERLWEHLPEFVQNTVDFYASELPDFATAHYADGGYCAALMEALTGIRFSFTGHSLGAQKLDKLGMNRANAADMENRFCFSKRIAAERLSMERACRIITSTRQEREQQYGHPLYQGAVDVADDSRFALIPPGVNETVFSTEAGAMDSVAGKSLDASLKKPGRPYLVLSSRLDEKKNIIGAVQAWAGSTQLYGRAGLALCIRGIDDPYRDIQSLPDAERSVLQPILDVISEAGLREQVDFLNIQSQAELAATYRYFARRGSVFVLTAFYEPFGLAPIEAAASGLACVATKNGGPTEIFADGSGVLVDPFDIDDIAAGLIRALDDYKDLSQRAAQRVRTTYTWQSTAAAYIEAGKNCSAQGPTELQPVPELDGGQRLGQYLS